MGLAPLRKSVPRFLHSLSILLLLVVPRFDPSTASATEASELQTLVEKQEAQLRRLENLVDILQRTVDRLPQPPAPSEEKISGLQGNPAPATKGAIPVANPPAAKECGRRANCGKGMTVARYRPAWSERFQFLSAVKVATEVTCVNILPHDGEEGVSKYVAVGDEQGRVYIFLAQGDALVEFLTLSPSPVTAMLSYLTARRNETVLVTGHADGAVLMHRVWEITTTTGGGHAAGEDWHVLAMEHARALVPPPGSHGGGGGAGGADAVAILEVHRVGRMRYVLGADGRGRIRVFRENGTLYGAAASPGGRPLAFLRQRLLFLTEAGAGSLDLRSMTVRKAECEGLNGSTAVAYAFDAAERSKGYGFTAEGDLVHVVLLGDILNFECRVRARRRAEIVDGGPGPLAVRAIKGYLLVGNSEKVFVYNTTASQGGGYARRAGAGPRPLFFGTLEEIASAFVDAGEEARKGPPLIACNGDRLVVLGLGGGYVGMYRSKLPVHRAEFNTVLWSSPVLVFVLFLAGAWQLLGKRREGFSAWGLDEPFDGTGGCSSASAERDRRENFRGGPTRRYGSPSRYHHPPGGTTALAYRGPAVDPDFRAQAAEAPGGGGGYSKRREPLFSSSQVVEETLH